MCENDQSDVGCWMILEGLITQDTAALEASLTAFLATTQGSEWLCRVHGPETTPEGFLRDVKANAKPFLDDLVRSRPLNTGALPPPNAAEVGREILDACAESSADDPTDEYWKSLDEQEADELEENNE